MTDAPKLLVEWSSPWQEFLTSIQPALSRSPAHLAGEARTGLFPYRGMLACWLLEIVLLVAAIVLPARLAMIRPYTPLPFPKYDVIYFSGDELPQTEDQGGARAGRSGRAGGKEGHHRTQTIRVARGEALREKVVDAPKLNLPRSDSAVANLLAYKTIPGPAPAEGLKSSRTGPVLAQNAVIAPPPEVKDDRPRAAPNLSPSIIPPAQNSPVRDVATVRLPGSHPVQVIPPPVSAPEQVTALNPKLTLPLPSVIAPPPSQVPREVASLGPGWGAAELHKQVIPPPAQLGNSTTSRQPVGGLGNSTVVPPPVEVTGGSLQRSTAGGLGGSAAVVPPPPSVPGGTGIGGNGSGRRGSGLGGPFDTGSVAAPPSNAGGNAGGTGVVVTSQPGSKVGVPGAGGTGALALSPSGGAKPGIGGSGGGSGIGRGTGPGSGFSGEGPGAAASGTGVGSDPTAHGGISPYPGPGGAGSGTSGKPAMPGVSVRGGSNIVTLPSFGSDANQPSVPGHSPAAGDRHGPGITVIATSRSGGAFNFYGAQPGDNYTIYFEIAGGTGVVMQVADPNSAIHAYKETLIAPEPLRADLPANLSHSRLIIACLLDQSGLLRNLQVLESGASEMTAKVLAALPNWKFRPAMRGDQPIEVKAFLGFNVDTR